MWLAVLFVGSGLLMSIIQYDRSLASRWVTAGAGIMFALITMGAILATFSRIEIWEEKIVERFFGRVTNSVLKSEIKQVCVKLVVDGSAQGLREKPYIVLKDDRCDLKQDYVEYSCSKKNLERTRMFCDKEITIEAESWNETMFGDKEAWVKKRFGDRFWN